jgi:hypothetical protein
MESTHRTRRRIAVEVARRLAEYGGRDDPAHLRRQVAREFGITDPRALPDLSEIQAALTAHHALLGGSGGTQHLHALRRAAIQAMEFFQAFSPRLTGPALEGPAWSHSAIELHLHCDNPDEVATFLQDHGIPITSSNRKVLLRPGESVMAPFHTFSADGLPVSLLVLPEESLRQPPLDRIDARPMVRATPGRVRRLVDAAD